MVHAAIANPAARAGGPRRPDQDTNAPKNTRLIYELINTVFFNTPPPSKEADGFGE